MSVFSTTYWFVTDTYILQGTIRNVSREPGKFAIVSSHKFTCTRQHLLQNYGTWGDNVGSNVVRKVVTHAYIKGTEGSERRTLKQVCVTRAMSMTIFGLRQSLNVEFSDVCVPERFSTHLTVGRKSHSLKPPLECVR